MAHTFELVEKIMEKDKVEFKILDAKLVGSDTVVFKLEDGAGVKIRVDIGRAAVATNFQNPDGSPHFMINPNIQIKIIPGTRKFYVPKSKLRMPKPTKESTFKPI